jgi:hypothetical protein
MALAGTDRRADGCDALEGVKNDTKRYRKVCGGHVDDIWITLMMKPGLKHNEM